MEYYDSCFDMFLHCKEDIVEKLVQFREGLVIDELVKSNSSAKEELKNVSPISGFYVYNYKFTELGKNLEKLI